MFVCAVIFFLLALIINHVFFMATKEGLATSKCTITASSPAACQSIAIHKNTDGLVHTKELQNKTKTDISKQLDELSKSIADRKKKIGINSSNIATNFKNIASMNAAVSSPKKKK